jgi:hypothetical protein
MQIYLDFFYQINASIYINAKKSLEKRDEWCKKSLEKCKLQATKLRSNKLKNLRFSCTYQKILVILHAKITQRGLPADANGVHPMGEA